MNDIRVYFQNISQSPKLRARAYLELSQESRAEFAALPVEQQVALLCVPNKQKNRFYKPKGDLLTVATDYATFKSTQKAMVQESKKAESKKELEKYAKSIKMRVAEKFEI